MTIYAHMAPEWQPHTTDRVAWREEAGEPVSSPVPPRGEWWMPPGPGVLAEAVLRGQTAVEVLHPVEHVVARWVHTGKPGIWSMIRIETRPGPAPYRATKYTWLPPRGQEDDT